jgi:membrane protein DedA with SNARE-associated domain/membrane-associated phospholipid phosphatase
MRPIVLVLAVPVAAFLARRWRRLSAETRIGGAIVVGLLLVIGSGLVELPNVEELIKDAGAALGSYTYLLVGILAFLETAAFVGLIAPGEFTIIFGGVVAGQGEIDVVALLAVVWGSAVAGDTTSFLLGRRLGRGFLERHGPRVHITEDRLRQVERFFARHGGKAILIGRFVGIVRAVAPFLAGASRMPYRRFAPYDIIGAGVWAATFVFLGFVFWHSFDRVAELAGKGAFALGTVIVLVVGLVVAVRYLRRPEGRAQARAKMRELEQRPLLRPVIRTARPIARRFVYPFARRAYRPLRFVWQRLTPGELGLELTTLLAVLSVGGFVFAAYAVTLQDQRFTPGDFRGLDLADDLRQASVVDVVKVFTVLAALPVAAGVTALTSLTLAVRRRFADAVALVCGLGLVVLAVHIAKDDLDRPRPLSPLVETEGHSFPSGHAAYSVVYVAVAVALARTVPWLGRFAVVTVAVAVAAALGLSRVYLRAHFVSDVAGGWGLAAAIFALCAIVALVATHVRQNGGSAVGP